MKIQLMFYKGKGDLFDKLIRWWTHSEYSHVELVIGGMWYSSSPRTGRVAGRELVYNESHWDSVEVEANEGQIKRMTRLFRQERGKKYDWLGITLSQILPLGIDMPNRWFCSEICAYVLKKSCTVRLDEKASWYSPQRLYEAVKE